MGVKVATVLVTSRVTTPDTLLPDESARVKVPVRPVRVAGFMGRLKVAMACSPVTILRWLLTLVGVLVASLEGLVEMTAGAVYAIRFVVNAAHMGKSRAINQVRAVGFMQKLFIEPFLMDAESGLARSASRSATL